MSEPRAASAASLEPGQGQGPARDAVIGAAMEPNDNADQLTISPETVFYIIVKAREFDEKVAPSDPNSGSNPADDRAQVLTLGVAQPRILAGQIVASIGPCRRDEEIEGGATGFIHQPAHDLLRLHIDGIRFHRGVLLDQETTSSSFITSSTCKMRS